MKLFLTLLIFIVLGHSSYAQKFKQERYKNFDKRMFHFGFMLGFNSNDFTVYQDVNAYEQYGLKLLENDAQPGGQLGILTTMKLGTPVLRLRFIPTLSFQERLLRYTFEDTVLNKDEIGEERVNSTNLDFPLMLQFRTKRLNNFAAYVLVGGQYSIDLQSQEKASQNYIDPYVKIKRNDLQGQIGGGLEFFAPYFKFGIEIKYSHGFINSFIQDNTNIAKPINKLYNKVWSLSLIFEG
ncbi:MAG: porin family protein [Flavobacteriia bacterium]|nr:porin family protein [Flavobacteriia bacterium]